MESINLMKESSLQKGDPEDLILLKLCEYIKILCLCAKSDVNHNVIKNARFHSFGPMIEAGASQGRVDRALSQSVLGSLSAERLGHFRCSTDIIT